MARQLTFLPTPPAEDWTPESEFAHQAAAELDAVVVEPFLPHDEDTQPYTPVQPWPLEDDYSDVTLHIEEAAEQVRQAHGDDTARDDAIAVLIDDLAVARAGFVMMSIIALVMGIMLAIVGGV